MPENEADAESFRVWWHNEGSALRPQPDEDTEEHLHRVTRIAWMNGAFKAREETQKPQTDATA